MSGKQHGCLAKPNHTGADICNMSGISIEPLFGQHEENNSGRGPNFERSLEHRLPHAELH